MNFIWPENELLTDVSGRYVDQRRNAKSQQHRSRTRQVIAVAVIERNQGRISGHAALARAPIPQF